MRELHCDVLVIGAGPAGLAAAATAAETGRRTVLVERSPLPGGQIWRAEGDQPAALARPWLRRLEQAGVEILLGTTVAQGDGKALQLFAEGPEGPLRLRGQRLVLATGAQELFLPFPGWTLPGVYGVGGLQALAKGGLDLRGRAVAICGSGPLLLAVAADLRRRGVQVRALTEQAALGHLLRATARLAAYPTKLLQLLRLRLALGPLQPQTATWPVEALGGQQLRAVRLRSAGGKERTVEVEALACAFGLVPRPRLAALLGCAVEDGRVVVDPHQQTTVPGIFAAGEPTGIGGVELSLAEGQAAGLAAADHSIPHTLHRQLERWRRFAKVLEKTFALRPELSTLPTPQTIVCRCEDVLWGDLQNHQDPREAKLQTRCGMGPCQGRVCGPALNHLLGFPEAPPRPPLFPIPIDHWSS